MIRLSREIRFALNSPGAATSDAKNGWAGWPATDHLAPQLKLQMVIAGQPDLRTGYLCNIKLIDRLLRTIVVDELLPAYADGAIKTLPVMLDRVWQRVHVLWPQHVDAPVPRLEQLVLYASPYLKFTKVAGQFGAPTTVGTTMNEEKNDIGFSSDQASVADNLNRSAEPTISVAPKFPAVPVVLTQQFEFSAAHRLHCDGLTETENRALFGKCNNPSGHGHNYVIEVSVRHCDPQRSVDLSAMEATVKEIVIDSLDHKHLNQDVEYFRHVNPTVENIAAAIFGWLDGKFNDNVLTAVRVYETPKTWAECQAP